MEESHRCRGSPRGNTRGRRLWRGHGEFHGRSGSDREPETTLTVLAAASLTDAFPKLGVEFQNAHPGTTVKFSYGGSSALAQQIVQGAPADVFAAASPATMKTVTDAGDVDGTPQNFVSNQLVIAVPPGNSKNLDMARQFVAFMLTPAVLTELEGAGFQAPQ